MKDGIFISYRREDASTFADIIYSQLSRHFLTDNIFKDHKTLTPGCDFKKEIDSAIENASVLLILISKHWLQENNEGKSRLFNEDDFVRYEILNAIEKDLIIIPVLLENSKLPSREQIPEILWPICDRQSFTIHPEAAMKDISTLIEVIKSKRKFKYDQRTLFGGFERLAKSPVDNLKHSLKDVIEAYKKDFQSLSNLFKKRK